MATLPLFLLSAAGQLHHWFRDIAYDDMARQARGWVPEDLLIDKKPRPQQNIKLDFAIPRKHRLNWARRRVNQLPH